MTEVIRLKARRQFTRLSKIGKSRACTAFVLLSEQTKTAGQIQIGFTASKKVGNAVKRNRAKRRLRALTDELIRLNPNFALPQGQGLDIVLIARAGAIDCPFDKMKADLTQLLKGLKCTL